MAVSTPFCKQLNNLVTALVIVGCVVLIIMEMNLPNLKLNKSNLLLNVVNHLKDKNSQAKPLNFTHMNYLDRMEINAARWFLNYFTIEKIDASKLFDQFEAKAKSAAEHLDTVFTNICKEILRNRSHLLSKSSYSKLESGFVDGAIIKMNSSISVMCKFLVGDLHNIFPTKQLGEYFSIVIMNTLYQQIQAGMGKIISTMNKLNTVKCNDNLAAMIGMNAAINQEIYIKLRRCKSFVLFRPNECLDSVDFQFFSKSYIKSTFAIDYDALDGHFFDQWTSFRIVGNLPVLEPTELTTATVMEHFMFRGDLMISESTDMDELRRILRGVSLAKEHLKDRCSEMNMFTVRCRRKNIVSVTLPCLYDFREQETLDYINCTVPIIMLYKKHGSAFEGTIFEKIGKEMTGYPIFTGKAFYWSFFDPQIPEVMPF